MASRRDRREQAKRDRRKASLVPDAELASPVSFAILWVRESSSGEWVEQYSCDSGHGYYHEHVHGHRGKDRRDIMPLHTQVDVQECWNDAYDRVAHRHDQNCRG